MVINYYNSWPKRVALEYNFVAPCTRFEREIPLPLYLGRGRTWSVNQVSLVIGGNTVVMHDPTEENPDSAES